MRPAIGVTMQGVPQSGRQPIWQPILGLGVLMGPGRFNPNRIAVPVVNRLAFLVDLLDFFELPFGQRPNRFNFWPPPSFLNPLNYQCEC